MEILIGPPGSGKTYQCYQKIKNTLKQNKKDKIIMIVPEQFSLEIERELTQYLAPGLLLVEVSSFTKLVLKANITTPILDELERIMILKKVLEDHHHELTFFTTSYNKDGFLEKINILLTNCENFGVTQLGDDTVEGTLKAKLADIQKISKWFYDFISTQFLTNEGSLNALIKSLTTTEAYKDALIIIDGFYSFTAAQQKVLLKLHSMARQMIVTLPMDKEYLGSNQNHLYYKSYNTLINFEFAVPVSKQFTNSAFANKTADIQFIADNYFATHSIKQPRDSANVRLFACRNFESEIELVAQNITRFVRDDTYRYNEIAIITGNLNLYRSHLTTVLGQYDIPYFLDETKTIQANPAVNFILNLLEVITQHWNLTAILSFLKSGILTDFADEDIDYLENYLYEHGINYKNKWLEAWEEETDSTLINDLRTRVASIILGIEQKIIAHKHRGKILTSNLCRILYDFLVEINFANTIRWESKSESEIEHTLSKNFNLALEYKHIYQTILDILDRLVDILGNQYVNIATFKSILTTCFKHEKVGTIPATQDQILVGEIPRTRLPKQKIVFLIGLNEGVFPANPINDSLFSDMDLTANLFNANPNLYELFIYSNLYGSELEIYSTLIKPSRYLFASYSMGDDSGKITRPSIIFTRLKRMFTMYAPSTTATTFADQIYTSKQAIIALGRAIKQNAGIATLDDSYKYALMWYMQHQPDAIVQTVNGLFFTNQQDKLQTDIAKKLYSNNQVTTVSRIEKFRRCPCAYFIEYGLLASERKLFKFRTPDIGTIFHSVLEIYPKLLQAAGSTWTTITPDAQQQLVATAVSESMLQNNKLKIKNGHTKYLTKRIETMSNRAITAMASQLKCGKFVPAEYEYKFNDAALPAIEINLGETTLRLTGTIDRVDAYLTPDGDTYIKIIDYKSGHTQFDFTEAYYALQLQLLLYLDAYLQINKDAKTAGVYYFKLDASRVAYKPGETATDMAHKLLKTFKLSGITLNDADIAKAIEPELGNQIIDMAYTKSGAPNANAITATAEEFVAIRQFIINQVAALGKQILEGKVSITPYKLGTKTGCDYCNFHGICGFDETLPNNNYDTLQKISKSDAKDNMIN